MERLIAVLTACVLILWCEGVGRAVLVVMTGPSARRGTAPAAIFVGMMALGNLMFLLAAVHALQLSAMIASLLVAYGAAWWIARGHDLPSTRPLHVPPAILVPSLLGLVVPVVICTLPTLFYDALVYHHPITQRFLDEGGLTRIPGLVYSNFPLVFELANAPALAVDGWGIAADLLSAAVGVCMVASTVSIARRVAGDGPAAWTMLLASLTPVLVLVRSLESNDVLVACGGVVAVDAALRARDEPAWWRVVPIAAAGSVMAKYSAAVQVLPVLCLVVAMLPGTRGARVQRIVLVGAASVLLNLPTFIKNALYTGNPFFPVAHRLFGGDGWSAEQAAFMAVDTHQASFSVEHLEKLGIAVWSMITGPRDPIDNTFAGALVLGALLCALRVRESGRLWGWAFACFVCWAASFPQGRFLAVTLLAASVAGGVTLHHLFTTASVGAKRILVVALAACAFLDAAMADRLVSVWQGAWLSASLPFSDVRAYVDESLEYPAASDAVQAALKPGQHALVVGDARCFHLRVRCEAASVLDVPPLHAMLEEARTPAEVHQWLRDRGATVIVLRPSEMARLAAYSPSWRLSERARALLVDALRVGTRPIYRSASGGTLAFALMENGAE